MPIAAAPTGISRKTAALVAVFDTSLTNPCPRTPAVFAAPMTDRSRTRLLITGGYCTGEGILYFMMANLSIREPRPGASTW